MTTTIEKPLASPAIHIRDKPITGRMLVGGELIESSGGEWIESLNPATEDFIGKVPRGTASDVDQAAQAAEAAQPAWEALSVEERGSYLRKLGDAILERTDELRTVEVAESGNPITPMRMDLVNGVRDLNYFAGIGYELRGESVPSTPGNVHFTIREPYGVVGRISAFNHPIYMALSGVAAPLVAGNSVILKPSEHCPLSTLLLGEIVRDVLPPGVLNILSGDFEVGNALVRHPRIKSLSFVGSARTGMAIQRSAAEVAVKNVTLELGGKNPFIAFPDAPIEKVAAAAVAGMNFNWQGQSCSSTSRFFLHDSIYDEVLERIVAIVGAVHPGDPFSANTRMGAINSRGQLDKVESYIEIGKNEGARLATGGVRPAGSGFAKGYWIEPAVFADVDPKMRIAREEVFGPILSVIRWTEIDSVIDAANSVEYGLTGIIYTNDITNALTVAKRLQTGYVMINGLMGVRFRGLPYGGYKNSGIGREGGIEELRSYTEEKAINIIL